MHNHKEGHEILGLGFPTKKFLYNDLDYINILAGEGVMVSIPMSEAGLKKAYRMKNLKETWARWYPKQIWLYHPLQK
jgi:hypothetical protein